MSSPSDPLTIGDSSDLDHCLQFPYFLAPYLPGFAACGILNYLEYVRQLISAQLKFVVVLSVAILFVVVLSIALCGNLN